MSLQEIPIARVSETIVRANSTKESQSKINISDFLCFKEDEDSAFPPDAAWVAVELMAEKSLPDEFLSAWKEIKSAANKNSRKITIRGYISDCQNVFILAPRFGKKVVKGVALVKNYISGDLRLRDIDRSLSTIVIRVNRRGEFCYIEDTEFELLPSDVLTMYNRE
jgi:hypothetical protein